MRSIIQVSGGIGNQLFQYAFALFLKNQLRFNVKLNRTIYHQQFEHEGFLLDQIFKLEVDLIDRDFRPLHWDKFIWKTRRVIENPKIHPLNVLEKRIHSFPRMSRLCLDGHWQCYLFPFMAKQDLRSIDLPAVQMEKFQSKTFIHIRGSDYFNTPTSSEFYDTIDEDYYDKSIAKVLEKEPNREFILFTDDLEYARRRLGAHMARISVDQTQSSLEVLAKMRACSGAIMANSSFSWWGAFLQENKGIQIAPKKWHSKMEAESAFIYPPYVIRY
jgi:hypothetical protein